MCTFFYSEGSTFRQQATNFRAAEPIAKVQHSSRSIPTTCELVTEEGDQEWAGGSQPLVQQGLGEVDSGTEQGQIAEPCGAYSQASSLRCLVCVSAHVNIHACEIYLPRVLGFFAGGSLTRTPQGPVSTDSSNSRYSPQPDQPSVPDVPGAPHGPLRRGGHRNAAGICPVSLIPLPVVLSQPEVQEKDKLARRDSSSSTQSSLPSVPDKDCAANTDALRALEGGYNQHHTRRAVAFANAQTAKARLKGTNPRRSRSLSANNSSTASMFAVALASIRRRGGSSVGISQLSSPTPHPPPSVAGRLVRTAGTGCGTTRISLSDSDVDLSLTLADAGCATGCRAPAAVSGPQAAPLMPPLSQPQPPQLSRLQTVATADGRVTTSASEERVRAASRSDRRVAIHGGDAAAANCVYGHVGSYVRRDTTFHVTDRWLGPSGGRAPMLEIAAEGRSRAVPTPQPQPQLPLAQARTSPPRTGHGFNAAGCAESPSTGAPADAAAAAIVVPASIASTAPTAAAAAASLAAAAENPLASVSAAAAALAPFDAAAAAPPTVAPAFSALTPAVVSGLLSAIAAVATATPAPTVPDASTPVALFLPLWQAFVAAIAASSATAATSSVPTVSAAPPRVETAALPVDSACSNLNMDAESTDSGDNADSRQNQLERAHWQRFLSARDDRGGTGSHWSTGCEAAAGCSRPLEAADIDVGLSDGLLGHAQTDWDCGADGLWGRAMLTERDVEEGGERGTRGSDCLHW